MTIKILSNVALNQINDIDNIIKSMTQLISSQLDTVSNFIKMCLRLNLNHIRFNMVILVNMLLQLHVKDHNIYSTYVIYFSAVLIRWRFWNLVFVRSSIWYKY